MLCLVSIINPVGQRFALSPALLLSGPVYLAFIFAFSLPCLSHPLPLSPTSPGPPSRLLTPSQVAALQQALEANRRCQAALHATLADVTLREREAQEALRRVRTVTGFERRARRGLRREEAASVAATEAARERGSYRGLGIGGHASEMLLVNWASKRLKRGRKHKYSVMVRGGEGGADEWFV